MLAPVVQKMDSAIHQINRYPADEYWGNQLRYPVDSSIHLLNDWRLGLFNSRTVSVNRGSIETTMNSFTLTDYYR